MLKLFKGHDYYKQEDKTNCSICLTISLLMPKVSLELRLWSQIFPLVSLSFTFCAFSPQSFFRGGSCYKQMKRIESLGVGYIFYFFAFPVVRKEPPSSIILIEVHGAPIYSIQNRIWSVQILIYVLSVFRHYIFLTVIWTLLFIISPQWRPCCNELLYSDTFLFAG